MSERQSKQCGTCHGNGGKTVDTSSNGIQRRNWKTCGTCQGSGQAGGGR